MQSVYLDEAKLREEFAIRAAKHFVHYPDHMSYTDEDIEKGELFALRFGLDNNCVVVFRIQENEPVLNYINLIEECKNNKL